MQSEIVQSEIFNCISHSIRLKEVQTVVAVNSIPLLSLNCLILGPYGFPTALPLTLLHPIFGQFVDDAENYVPTPVDAQFLLAFVEGMVNIYATEKMRQNILLKVFNDHDILMKPTGIDRFITNGDLSVGKYRFLIAKIKNEVGSSGAEPYFQAILYFLEATRELATQHLNSVLPCIIVLVFGL